MRIATDEQLIAASKRDRSEALAKLYDEQAQNAQCNCGSVHERFILDCPRGVWEAAARMARMARMFGKV